MFILLRQELRQIFDVVPRTSTTVQETAGKPYHMQIENLHTVRLEKVKDAKSIICEERQKLNSLARIYLTQYTYEFWHH